jgi:hypothetical protein
LKFQFSQIEKNIELVALETDAQLSTMSRLVNIIRSGVPDQSPDTKSLKLRIKRRRKQKLEGYENNLFPSTEDRSDVIIFGKPRKGANSTLVPPHSLPKRKSFVVTIQNHDEEVADINENVGIK